MFVSYRNLTALAALCLAIVVFSLAMKISRSRSEHSQVVASEPSILNWSSTPEASFYGPAVATNVSAKSAKPSVPVVTALAYLVGNVSTGQILMEKKDTAVLPVASMSKLITAIAAIDTMTPTTTILITEQEAEVASDTSMLTSGESFTVSELLYPLLLNSSNVAAEALASSSDRGRFLELMPSYAWEVGMPSTFFADPSGLSPRNISTAKDFFALAEYLYKSRPDILAISRTAHFAVGTTTLHNAHDFVSIHPFIANKDFLGGKTGHTTEAGDTMLTIMNIAGQPIAFIVLGSKTGGRAGDTQLLIDEYKKSLSN